MLVVAHRGASGSAPENTLAALERARALGATWAEVDVQRTADGVLVLVHDDTWRRTTGLDRAVGATPWEVVRQLDAGSWFGPAFAGEPPPRLEAVLALAAQGLHLDLEIKSPENHPGLGGEVVAAVRAHGVAARVLLTSFDLDLVATLADAAPDIACGWLATAPVARRHPGVGTLALNAAAVLRDPVLVAAAHAAGQRLFVWTVDDPDMARRLARFGVDGVITNHPERLLPVVGGAGSD